MVLRHKAALMLMALGAISGCATQKTSPAGLTESGDVQVAKPLGGSPPSPPFSDDRAYASARWCGERFYGQANREADLSQPYSRRVYWTDEGPCKRSPRAERRP